MSDVALILGLIVVALCGVVVLFCAVANTPRSDEVSDAQLEEYRREFMRSMPERRRRRLERESENA